MPTFVDLELTDLDRTKSICDKFVEGTGKDCPYTKNVCCNCSAYRKNDTRTRVMSVERIKGVDRECVNLCNAINEVPYLQTLSSCCGHGKASYNIWFMASRLSNLFILGRAINRRYCGFPDRRPTTWLCPLSISDTPERAVGFHLTSGETKGEKAYEEADIIAANIRHLMNWDKVLDMFNVERP